MNRFDQAMRTSLIAERSAKDADRLVDGAVANGCSLPHDVEQFFTCDHAVTVDREIPEQVEGQGLEIDRLSVPAYFEAGQIDLDVGDACLASSLFAVWRHWM